MNFGQHWRTPGICDVRYGVTLPLAFVASVLSRELPEYVRDCLACPGSDPFEVALRDRQWPDARPVLDDAELCRLALDWFGLDSLREWLGDGEPGEEPGYVINAITSAERRGDAVRFAGAARSASQWVQYQDV
jgi:hypothetical protein